MNLKKLTSLPMCGLIAHLVEHRTGIAEVTLSDTKNLYSTSLSSYLLALFQNKSSCQTSLTKKLFLYFNENKPVGQTICA